MAWRAAVRPCQRTGFRRFALGLDRFGGGFQFGDLSAHQLPVFSIDAQGSAFQGSPLQKLDRDAIGRTDKGHAAVARRLVDGHAAILELLTKA